MQAENTEEAEVQNGEAPGHCCISAVVSAKFMGGNLIANVTVSRSGASRGWLSSQGSALTDRMGALTEEVRGACPPTHSW